MVDRETRIERDVRHVDRSDAAQTWGIIAVLAVLALIGWGIWAAMDNRGVAPTGTAVDDDDLNVDIDAPVEDRDPDVVIDEDDGVDRERIIERDRTTTTTTTAGGADTTEDTTMTEEETTAP